MRTIKNHTKLASLAALLATAMTLSASAATWELIQLEPFPLDGATSSEWQTKTWESV